LGGPFESEKNNEKKKNSHTKKELARLTVKFSAIDVFLLPFSQF